MTTTIFFPNSMAGASYHESAEAAHEETRARVYAKVRILSAVDAGISLRLVQRGAIDRPAPGPLIARFMLTFGSSAGYLTQTSRRRSAAVVPRSRRGAGAITPRTSAAELLLYDLMT
jgi:hypothetical protein